MFQLRIFYLHVKKIKKILDNNTDFYKICKLNNRKMLTDSQISALKGIIKKPHVNSTCIGCSACTAISGEVFELNDDGLSCVRNLSNYDGHDVDDSIAACPVNAISWQEADENGNYLHGIKEHEDV